MMRGNGRVEVHGHRGARGLRPENTLPGFAHALEIGVDALELDVGITADGAVVVHHDQSLSAVTTTDTGPAWPGDPAHPYVGRPIRELTLAQLRTVDAGVRRASDDDPFVLTQLPIPGTGLPLLAEVCAMVDRHDAGHVRLAVELKTDPGWPAYEIDRFVAAVAGVLEPAGWAWRARLLAFDWRVLVAARRHAPGIERVALVEPVTLADGSAWLAGHRPADHLSGAVEIGAAILSPHHSLVGPGLVDEAGLRGLPLSVWTVNDTADMARFVDHGVHAIVTDYPDRLHRVLTARGRPVPASRPARRPAAAP